MAENSAISWTDHTFNPWWGCTKVGPGCDHCYAETFDKRVGGDHWGAGKPRREIKDWSKPRKWNREAEKTGVSPWVFCASMADVFDNEVPAEWRERLWQLVRETPKLRWIFVTKRIGNAAKMLPADWPAAFGHCGLCATIVNQAEADRDIPKLLATPAAWRGISAEPLLGPIDLVDTPYYDTPMGISGRGYLRRGNAPKGFIHPAKLDWVIVGGESGSHARPMHPQWARDIRDQCVAAGVSFHFKQWGEWHPREWCRDGGTHAMRASSTLSFQKIQSHPDSIERVGAGEDWSAFARVGKKAAGRLLDGREHNGMPPPMGAGRLPPL